ncbi:MAG: T9SS type A sorting domain-containing protein [Bacteroidota bacterium]
MRSYIMYNLIRLKRQSIVAVLCLVLSLIGFFEVSAQKVYGWDKIFEEIGPDEAKGIVEMRDRGLVMVGNTNSFGLGFQIYTIRTDVDGTVLWTDTLGTAGSEMGLDITVSSDQNGVVIVGNGENLINGGKDVIYFKLDDDGNKVWTKSFSTNNDDEAFGITTANDGGYIITGYTENDQGIKDLFLLKVDSDGNELWNNTYGGDFDDAGNAVAQLSNGNIIATGYTIDTNDDRDIFVVGTDVDGNVLFESNYGTGTGQFDEGRDLVIGNDGSINITGQVGNQSNVAFLKLANDGAFIGLFSYGNSTFFQQGNGIQLADDGNLVIAGFNEASASDLNVFLLKISQDGGTTPIWEKSIGQADRTELGFDLVKTYDGGFAVAGSRAQTAFSSPDVYLLRTNKNGELLTNHIVGRAYRDNNNDCNFQAGEGGVRDWIVEAKGDDRTFYGSVDADGHFDVLTDTGSYEVNIIVPNVYWNSSTCQTLNFPIQVGSFDTIYLDYPIQTEIECPVMEVDVSTPRIIPCEDNIYRVDFCNQGTQIAVGATVDVIFEKNLTVNSSSLPWVMQDDSLFVFAIGNIDVGECGFFEVEVTADCNIVNEAHCVEATILPDDTCLADDPNWDGSSIRVDSYCGGDSVIFLLQNVGDGPMTQSSDFIVIEDIVLMFQGQPQSTELLPTGATQRIAIPANGKHYRLVVDQPANHPGRNYFATNSVEGCDPNNQGVSLGYVTQLEEADRDPYQSKDCIENQLSFDATDFIGYPKGYRDTCSTDADLITSQTDLKYHIRFQNVGSDTSQRVVIRDTIPSHLDITSIRPGASSHPYTFEAYGDGFVKFTFSDLNQVNNTTDEMLSHGFVKYRISQKPNNPVGTIIENGAIIFQDYDVPTDTESVRHQVGGDNLTDFLCFLTSIENPDYPNVSLEVYPNPFTDFTMITVEGAQFGEMEFRLFDATGKLVRTEYFENNTLEFYRNQLSQGLYVFTINVKGQAVRSGKLIIQ